MSGVVIDVAVAVSTLLLVLLSAWLCRRARQLRRSKAAGGSAYLPRARTNPCVVSVGATSASSGEISSVGPLRSSSSHAVLNTAGAQPAVTSAFEPAQEAASGTLYEVGARVYIKRSGGAESLGTVRSVNGSGTYRVALDGGGTKNVPAVYALDVLRPGPAVSVAPPASRRSGSCRPKPAMMAPVHENAVDATTYL